MSLASEKRESANEPCMICHKPVPEYEAEHCCDGRECGCMGRPIEPCVCGEACWNALIKLKGTFEERRIAAGIEIHTKELKNDGH